MNIKKVPCFAIIVGSISNNDGKIVEVLRQYFDEEIIEGRRFTGPSIKWVIESCGSLLNNISNVNGISNGISNGFSKQRAMADFCLIPVSGLGDPEQIDAEQPILDKAPE